MIPASSLLPPRWSISSHSSQSEMSLLWARPATTSTKCATPRACGDVSVAGSVLAYESRVLGSGPGRELPFLTVHFPRNSRALCLCPTLFWDPSCSKELPQHSQPNFQGPFLWKSPLDSNMRPPLDSNMRPPALQASSSTL